MAHSTASNPTVRMSIRKNLGKSVMTVVLKLIDARGNPIKGESKVPGHVDEIDIEA